MAIPSRIRQFTRTAQIFLIFDFCLEFMNSLRRDGLCRKTNGAHILTTIIPEPTICYVHGQRIHQNVVYPKTEEGRILPKNVILSAANRSEAEIRGVEGSLDGEPKG